MMIAHSTAGLELTSDNRGYDNGHRGIWLERGQDNLITNFKVLTKLYHDTSVSFYEHSTAFVNGSGKARKSTRMQSSIPAKHGMSFLLQLGMQISMPGLRGRPTRICTHTDTHSQLIACLMRCMSQDLNMDHHRAAPYAILWSNIDTGIGSRSFDSSGNEVINGNHSSSFITFWNVRHVGRIYHFHHECSGSCY